MTYLFLFQLILLNTERKTKHCSKNEVKRYSDVHINYKDLSDEKIANDKNIESTRQFTSIVYFI